MDAPESTPHHRSRRCAHLTNRTGRSFLKFLTAAMLVTLIAVGFRHQPVRAATNRFASPSGNDDSGANTCTDPGNPCQTVQIAVNQSASGDTIELAAGTYTENVNISGNGSSLMLTIQGDAAGSIVDGNNRAFVFQVQNLVNVTFTTLTITNGAHMGAGILNGGGGTVTVNGCTISGNNGVNSESEGGGIFNTGTLTVINSTIENNSAGELGGGIFNSDGTATIVNSTIKGNSAALGGGICSGPRGTVTVNGCAIYGNTASNGGGGIFNEATLTVINGTIANNSGGFGGGGIYNIQTVTITNSTISGNSSSGSGDGGGVLSQALGVRASHNLTNTIIAGNDPSDFIGDVNPSFDTSINDHNLVEDGRLPGALAENPMLGPLQNNGGPTETMALLTGSPCIGAGDNSVAGSPLNLMTDQRGPGFPREIGTRVDIGAYEFAAGCPAVTQNPVSQTITGGPVTFTAAASGDPAPSVQWQVSTDGGATFTDIPGATSTTLTFTPAPAQSGDKYRAVFTNECGSAATVAATLTLLNVCLKDNTTGNLLQWNSTTGQYMFTRCSGGFTLTGTGVVKVVNGLQTLTDSKSDRRMSAARNPGQVTGSATIYFEYAQGLWATFAIKDTNPGAVCTCSG